MSINHIYKIPAMKLTYSYSPTLHLSPSDTFSFIIPIKSNFGSNADTCILVPNTLSKCYSSVLQFFSTTFFANTYLS